MEKTASNDRTVGKPLQRGFMGIRMGILLLLATVFRADRSAAQAEPSLIEDKVKAAFVFNFIKFIEWPSTAFERADAPMVVDVLGAVDIASAMEEAMREKTVNKRPLIVRRLTRAEEISNDSTCHLLFIGRSEQARMAEICRHFGKTGMVTVADSEGFLEQGGMINLVVEENKVRFEINAAAANRAGLTISSQLLKLAKRVVSVHARKGE